MSMATIGTRYQVVIPLKEGRKAKLEPGQKVNVIHENGRIVLEPAGHTRSVRAAA